jgi:hypothetical protein
VGEALARAEDRQVKSVQAQAQQARSQAAEERQTKQIERLSIEWDGVMARLRRGSVLMEKEERQRKGDVYRQIKAGAVCACRARTQAVRAGAWGLCRYKRARQSALCGSPHGQGRL